MGAIIRAVRAVLLVCLLAGPAVAVEPPAAPPTGLACLRRHYAVEPVLRAGAWHGRIGEQLVPWDDGRRKTLELALDGPDLEDMLARAYPTGTIQPITDADHDPGRVRVDALFAATYPRKDVQQVTLFGRRLRVHARALPAFRKVEARLAQLTAEQPALAPWLDKLSGTFVERKIAGTDRTSSHSYGVSIDLDASRTHYWRWQRPATPLVWRNTVPQAIVDAFEQAGFIWGGRWYHYDTMHFEYRPELLDPACRVRR
jgi:hypothetical protein